MKRPEPPPLLHADLCRQLAERGLVELRTWDVGRGYLIQRPEDVLMALKLFIEKEGAPPQWFEFKYHNYLIFGRWPKDA